MLKEQEQAVIERILSRAGLLSEYYNKAVAKVLVEVGYRKADEVRKETAKEILQALWEFKEERQNGLHCEPRDGDISAIYRRGGASIAYDKLRDEIQRQCKKYGVEVDE